MDLEELYDRFGDRAYHYLYIKLGSAGDAEDVLQEVFYRLARYSIRLKFIRNSISGLDEESVQILSASLAQLPEEQREIIVLKFFEELTFKEIASALGLSINTAASRYRYEEFLRLKEELNEDKI